MQADVILKEPLPWITPPPQWGDKVSGDVQYTHDS